VGLTTRACVGREIVAMLDTAVCIHCNKQILLEEEIFVVVGEARALAGGTPRYAHADCRGTQLLMPVTGPRWETVERQT
jgi:hypothetical protein